MPDTSSPSEPLPSIRAQTKAHHASLILTAAAKVFKARGYHAATLREIAKTAGFSTGAIFNTYKGKDELYALIHGHPPVTPEEGLELRKQVAALTAERALLQDAAVSLALGHQVTA